MHYVDLWSRLQNSNQQFKFPAHLRIFYANLEILTENDDII